jgi:hypothetical protein
MITSTLVKYAQLIRSGLTLIVTPNLEISVRVVPLLSTASTSSPSVFKTQSVLIVLNMSNHSLLILPQPSYLKQITQLALVSCVPIEIIVLAEESTLFDPLYNQIPLIQILSTPILLIRILVLSDQLIRLRQLILWFHPTSRQRVL